MAAKPLDHIHFVGIVAEWLVAVLETYAHAVRVPERNKPANNPYRHCAGMPPWVQAAKLASACYENSTISEGAARNL